MTEQSKSFVALVDDDRSVVKSLARMLRSLGYEVGAFDSAKEFLNSVEALTPDCLILDVHMPEMGGIELHTRLRAMGIRIPIVFMTAQDSSHIRAVAEQSGNLGLLLKPFEIPALLAVLDRAAALRQGPTP
ncbi:MAG: response regulator [Verrucomicrobiota bacterium]|nr:response regulator [Verrucomicrobiota bacterium]